MNLLVISDLHIGDKDNFGIFGWDQDDFIKKVQKVRKKYAIDQVVLNGDIFELYKYTFEQVKNCNSRLINYFIDNGFIIIKGNHDALSPLGQDHYLFKNSQDMKIYIEHGHNADFMNGTKLGRFIGRIGFSILKLLTRWEFVLKIYFKIVESNDNVNRIPKKYDSYIYLTYALNLLKTYDLVILGHTHKIEEHKTYYLNRKKKYINCGSCSLGRFQGIVMNTESLKHIVIKRDKKGK